jgi:hypothetical protein
MASFISFYFLVYHLEFHAVEVNCRLRARLDGSASRDRCSLLLACPAGDPREHDCTGSAEEYTPALHLMSSFSLPNIFSTLDILLLFVYKQINIFKTQIVIAHVSHQWPYLLCVRPSRFHIQSPALAMDSGANRRQH